MKESTDTIQNYIVEGSIQAIVDRYTRLAKKAAETDFGELDEDVVILDTETTGFSFNHDELIQIAAARMRKGVITEWFITFVNPGKPIPEEIVHLTDIGDADVCEAPHPEEALQKLAEFIGTTDVVAHNAEFDYNFVTKNAQGACLKENTWIDSLDLARIALPRLKSHRLLDLVRAFDAPISTHRADADVEALCVVYRILLAAISEMPYALVEKIAEMAEDEHWPTGKVFKSISAQEHLFTQHNAQSSKDRSSFSIKELRRARVEASTRKPKEDADNVAADPQRSLQFPEEMEVAQAFSPAGLVGGLYPEYEERGEQTSMAETVLRAFSTSTNLAIEAGTGVGKSMAYLLPAALVAQKNNITVGVATKTNALLDQLVYKELPLLTRALTHHSSDGGAAGVAADATAGVATDTTADNAIASAAANTNEKTSSHENRPLHYVALKGFSHYPCLRLVNRLVQEGPKSKMLTGKMVPQTPSIATLLSFIEQSEYNDIDTLKMDYRVLPRYSFTTSSHECLRRKCPFYGTQCFVHGARRQAESADIVVTNHSLLFCDLVADGGLLPPIRYWVVDEAHGTEAEARKAFSLTLSAEEMQRLARKVSSDEPSQNVFIRAERRAGALLDEASLFYALTTKARTAGKAFEAAATEFCSHIKDLSFFDTNRRSKGYELVELWINDDIRHSETFKALMAYGRVLCEAIEKLISANQEVVGILESVDEAAEVQREIATITIRLKETLNAAETILFTASPAYAYAATFSRKQDRVAERLDALLVNVGETLNETLFAQTHSVVFTSATLTVADSFDSFETSLGLNESEHSQAATCQLESSYDFDRNMTIYVADDIPEPNDPGYLAALQKLLISVHQAQHGSMLTLFTNRKEMEKCFDVVQPALKPHGLRLVCQKWGISAKGLRDDFLSDEHLSLFALKSFWEGFDAPGSTLKGVIIPKLPFAKPTDPLSCERALRDSQAWSHYVLPAAVLETKQAAGRLIRKANDTGCLILADRRLLTKGYGKAFLKSMPSKTIKVCSSATIAEELATNNNNED